MVFDLLADGFLLAGDGFLGADDGFLDAMAVEEGSELLWLLCGVSLAAEDPESTSEVAEDSDSLLAI